MESSADRCIFVGGTQFANAFELREYFMHFGEIEKVMIIKTESGRSRGFGFVTFCDANSAKSVLRNAIHFIQIDQRTLRVRVRAYERSTVQDDSYPDSYPVPSQPISRLMNVSSFAQDFRSQSSHNKASNARSSHSPSYCVRCSNSSYHPDQPCCPSRNGSNRIINERSTSVRSSRQPESLQNQSYWQSLRDQRLSESAWRLKGSKRTRPYFNWPSDGVSDKIELALDDAQSPAGSKDARSKQSRETRESNSVRNEARNIFARGSIDEPRARAVAIDVPMRSAASNEAPNCAPNAVSTGSDDALVSMASKMSISNPESSPESNLGIGERVVFLQDDSREHGTVRWIGLLTNGTQDAYAGVELDNPTGRGTGMLGGKRYFSTGTDCAAFIPLSALLKERDYLGLNDSRARLHTMDHIRVASESSIQSETRTGSTDSLEVSTTAERSTSYEPIPEPPSGADDSLTCQICFDRSVNSALYKCGHSILCYECAVACKNAGSGLCPVCRSRIRDVLKLYR